MKEYAVLNIVDKIIYLFAIIAVVLCFQHDDFIYLIVAGLIGNAAALGYAVYQCKDLIFAKTDSLHLAIGEAFENINAGSVLMLSTIAGMLSVLSAWLPDYADGLKYMALLFPLCIYESKMSMIIETYMKTLRLEKILLRINVISLLLCISLTGLIVFGLGNLELAVASITIVTAFRCIIAECELGKRITINTRRDRVLEVFLTAIFMISSWFIGGISGLCVYFLFYLIYLFIQRKEISKVFCALCMIKK